MAVSHRALADDQSRSLLHNVDEVDGEPEEIGTFQHAQEVDSSSSSFLPWSIYSDSFVTCESKSSTTASLPQESNDSSSHDQDQALQGPRTNEEEEFWLVDEDLLSTLWSAVRRLVMEFVDKFFPNVAFFLSSSWPAQILPMPEDHQELFHQEKQDEEVNRNDEQECLLESSSTSDGAGGPGNVFWGDSNQFAVLCSP